VDASIITALAALTGAAVGGLTSGVAAWLNHRSQVRTEWILHEKSRRQALYKDFIDEAKQRTQAAGEKAKRAVAGNDMPLGDRIMSNVKETAHKTAADIDAAKRDIRHGAAEHGDRGTRGVHRFGDDEQGGAGCGLRP